MSKSVVRSGQRFVTLWRSTMAGDICMSEVMELAFANCVVLENLLWLSTVCCHVSE